MSTPLSPQNHSFHPQIYTADDLRSNNDLTVSIIALENAGYSNRQIYPESRWGKIPDRFETLEALFTSLGPQGFVVAVFASGENEEDEDRGRQLVACACASPWKGDLRLGSSSEKGNDDEVAREAAKERGWEIKGVATHAAWLRKGLAGRCIAAIETEVARQEDEGKIRLWIHMVEEVNGEYWRRRGFTEVRRSKTAPGVFGAKFGVELVVMFKDVDVERS
jgi:GNAT superfamily N-acetyltransferase